MGPKQASRVVDSNSEEDMMCPNDFTVLIQFIYDTSSFSDRLVQLATIDTATEPAREEDHKPASGLAKADTSDEKKDIESTRSLFYPEHIIVE